MRLCTYAIGGASPRAGLVVGDGVVDLTRRGIPSARALLAEGLARADRYTEETPDHALADVTLLPPVLDPGKILCVGVNYDAHRAETGRDKSEHPTLFTRYADSLVGAGEPLVHPGISERYDFEGELAVIIGAPARRVSARDAMQHVAGYACFQDGSVRDFQRHTSQFTAGKNFERSGAFGPWLVDARGRDPRDGWRLETFVNGVLMQEGDTRDLVFDVPHLIAYISAFTTLRPGDVIATGTPSGVGDKRTPPVYLTPGDTVRVSIAGIGELESLVVSA